MDGESFKKPAETPEKEPVKIPTDKILCGGKFYRLVAACCRNCTEPQYCREFWEFFDKNGITPQEYLRKFGLEEDGMKRVVFDCDRCGKKDIGEPLTIFFTEGENEGERMPTAEFAAVVEKIGSVQVTTEYLMDLLELLNTHEKWEHYCTACFRKMLASSASLLGPRAKSRKKTSKVAGNGGMFAAGMAIASAKKPGKVVREPVEQDKPKPGRGRKKKTDT